MTNLLVELARFFPSGFFFRFVASKRFAFVRAGCRRSRGIAPCAWECEAIPGVDGPKARPRL